jgi:outer membrane protein OmpA-like peptidoglycan-associated protein
MAQRIGKCTNYSGCKLAYRNEKINVVTKEFRCPECGSPLESIGPKKGTPFTLIVGSGVAAVLLLATGAILWTLMSPPKRRTVLVELTPTPSPTPAATPTPTSTPTPESTPVPTATPAASPSPTAEIAGTTINLDMNTPEIDEVKRAVLKRIDQIPNLTQANRDKLYTAVERAHGLGRLFTVPFETRLTNLSAQDLAFIQNAVNQPQIKKLLDDPTLVLVILGFADKQGADAANQTLSLGRAQSVMEALRDKCGVQNIMHVVPMGGTNLLDAHNLAKNRVVEVWAALP